MKEGAPPRPLLTASPPPGSAHPTAPSQSRPRPPPSSCRGGAGPARPHLGFLQGAEAQLVHEGAPRRRPALSAAGHAASPAAAAQLHGGEGPRGERKREGTERGRCAATAAPQAAAAARSPLGAGPRPPGGAHAPCAPATAARPAPVSASVGRMRGGGGKGGCEAGACAFPSPHAVARSGGYTPHSAFPPLGTGLRPPRPPGSMGGGATAGDLAWGPGRGAAPRADPVPSCPVCVVPRAVGKLSARHRGTESRKTGRKG